MAAGSSCPTYLSARSADVILSDVRPVRIAPAALRALNVLLDELLWTVLAHARSLDTDRLHQALRKVLPTSLGKEALLEAEVELRAYLEKSPPISAQPADEEFALQYAFELLRIKCEAYATLNDQDEDNDAEAKLHLRNTGSAPPSASLIAPAALYLTAILECVCEHILSTVSRVASRDSSRTTATVQDLFTALCEDSSIFGLFKSMKVYAQIQEMTSESSHNRRKSFSQQGERPSSRTESPSSQDHTSSKGSASSTPRRPSVTSMKGRVSSDSKRPRAGSPAFRRASLEKARALAERVSGSRSSIEREEVPHLSSGAPDDVPRAQSGISENTKQVWRAFHDAHNSDRSSDPEEDGGLDFDEALRSGSTVKVSLTPDRLKSMETHKQGRRGNSRLNTSSTLSPVTPSDDEGTPIATKPTPPPARQPLAGTRRPSVPQVPQVASIQEDDEEGLAPAPAPSAFSSAHSTPAMPSSQPPPPIRRRSGSMTTAASAGASQRQRTMSTPRSVDLLAPKPKIIQTPQRPSHNELSGAPSAFPQKKRVVAKNRESMDLDDIMNGSDDEEDEADAPPSATVPSTPRQTRAPSARGTPRTPGGGVSQSTRDLMDFLQSGPPDDMTSPPTPLSRQNTGGNGTSSSKKDRSGGRLQRMMSRLRSGVSQEQLNKRAKEDGYAVPPTPPLPGSALNTGGLAGANRVNVNGATVIAYKPPRPPKPPQVPQPIVPSESPTDVTPTSINRSTSAISTSSPSTPVGSMPISPPASPLNGSLSRKSSNIVSGTTTPAQVPTPPSTSAQRRMSIQRKAVPSWIEDKAIIQPEPTIITTTPAENALHTPEPSSEASGGLSPIIPSPVNEEVRPLRPIRKNSAQSVRSEASPSQLPPGLEGTHAKDGEVVSEPTSSSDVVVVPKAQAAAVDTTPVPSLADMTQLRQLMAHATSAEECRLLYDMFLVRSGVSLFPASTEFNVPYPSPVRSETAELPAASFKKSRPSPIDPSLVEVLLGGGGGSVPTTPIYEFHDDASNDSHSASPVRDTLTVEA